MGFKFRNLKSSVQDNVEKIIEDWSYEFADWGIDGSELTFSAVNALSLWENLAEYSEIWNQARDFAEQGRNQSGDDTIPALPYLMPFQRPLFPPSMMYSYCLKDLEHSFDIGEEPPVQPVYAIDGSDQVAYEFTRGHKGGMGIATYGWVATYPDKDMEKHPQHRALQLVPADMQDAQNFTLLNFGKYPQINPDSMRVRNYAALRRTQLEFLQLSNLVDRVAPGSIIVVDGFLKAMFSPPVHFIHEVGKRAARKGVILVGVAKNSKIDMWLHFQEYWDGAGDGYSGWIRPPAPILDRAFPAYRTEDRPNPAEDVNQYLYLGERGRGIGIPIAVTLSPLRHQYYMVDFNCYDFEAAQVYRTTSRMPEVHGKFFPLTTRDKDFINYVLSQLAYYSKQITAVGYPFPAAAAHGLVKITRHDVDKVRTMARSEFLQCGYTLHDLDEFREDPHKIVDPF